MPPREALKFPIGPYDPNVDPSLHGHIAPSGNSWETEITADILAAPADPLTPELMRVAAANSPGYYQAAVRQLEYNTDDVETHILRDVVDPPLLRPLPNDWRPKTVFADAEGLASQGDLGQSPIALQARSLANKDSKLRELIHHANTPMRPVEGMSDAEFNAQVKAARQHDETLIHDTLAEMSDIIERHPSLARKIEATITQYSNTTRKSHETAKATSHKYGDAAQEVLGQSHPNAPEIDAYTGAHQVNVARDLGTATHEAALRTSTNDQNMATYADIVRGLPLVGAESEIEWLHDEAGRALAEASIQGDTESMHRAYASVVALRHRAESLRSVLDNNPKLEDEDRLYVGELYAQAEQRYNQSEYRRKMIDIHTAERFSDGSIDDRNRYLTRYTRRGNGGLITRNEYDQPTLLYEDGTTQQGTVDARGDILWEKRHNTNREELPPIRRTPMKQSPADFEPLHHGIDFSNILPRTVPETPAPTSHEEFFNNFNVYMDGIHTVVSEDYENWLRQPNQESTERLRDTFRQARTAFAHNLRTTPSSAGLLTPDMAERLTTALNRTEYMSYYLDHDRPTDGENRVRLLGDGAIEVFEVSTAQPDYRFIIYPDGSSYRPITSHWSRGNETRPDYVPPTPPPIPPMPPTPPTPPASPASAAPQPPVAPPSAGNTAQNPSARPRRTVRRPRF